MKIAGVLFSLMLLASAAYYGLSGGLLIGSDVSGVEIDPVSADGRAFFSVCYYLLPGGVTWRTAGLFNSAQEAANARCRLFRD